MTELAPVGHNGRARIGLAGYGFGGRYFHAPMLSTATNIDFVGVVTASAERRALVESDHPGTACFDDLDALAAAGAQAVAVSTPASTHVDLTLAALDLGLHVLCDKPFALTAADARRVAERAAAVDRLVVPYQNRRWDSDLLTLRAVLDAGTLGEVTHFASRFERFDVGGVVPAAGGGLLYDFGSHLADQALFLFGPVASVYAETGPTGVEPGHEVRFFASLSHESGMVSHLYGDWIQGSPGPRFRLTGTEGSFVVGPGMDGQELVLIAGQTPGTLGDRWGVEDESAWGWIQRGDDRTPVPSERGRWDLLYAEFARAVLGQGPSPVPVADAIASLAVLDACAESARTGQVVTPLR
ncbi:MAG TPA: Gfo/Idh/MocA family oxidoreductase [Propionibacteriaceae bacterium]